MTDTFVILDFNSCIIHSYNSGKDPDAYLIEGKQVNTPGYGIQVLLERYILHVAQYVPLNHILVVHDDLIVKDGKYTDYRTLYYPDYKRSRREKPKSVETQFLPETKQLARELLTSLGIPQISLANVEADDVIAYFAMNLPGEKHIYTTDADLISLAQYPGVKVFQKLEQKKDFKGVEPRFVTLFKSLCGDSSDGYGGVRGFGPAKWEAFDTKQLEFLDWVIQNKRFDKLDEAYERTQSKELKLIVDAKAEWTMAYHTLAKLHPEFVDAKPVETNYYDKPTGKTIILHGDRFNRLKWDKKVPNREKLLDVLKRSGTDYLLNRLEKFLPKQTLVTPSNLNLDLIKSQILNSRAVSLDWETWQEPNENFKKANKGKEFVDMLGSTISGMGITIGENWEHTYYFQFDHADRENNLSKHRLLEVLDVIPADMPIIAFNMYFEISVLISEFRVALPIMYDPMVMHKHIDELADDHGLKDLSKRYLHYDQLHYEDVIEKGKTMQDYTGQHVFQYGADDPLVTAHLFDLFYVILNTEKTWNFVRDCEFPTVQLLSESYVEGVSFDLEEVERQRVEDQTVYDTCIERMRELLRANNPSMKTLFENAKTLYLADINPKGSEEDNFEEIEALAKEFAYEEYREVPPEGRQKVSRWVGTELNLDSPKQMQYLFYGTLGLPIRIRDFKVSKTRKAKGLDGTPQVNEDAIDTAIVKEDATGWKLEVLENFSRAKKCATRVKLFYNKFPLWEHPRDGNLHPRFTACGTESRRPTGGSPNLLQLSKQGEGVKVRKSIVPNRKKGHDLVCSLDWAGEELRLLAHVAKDVAMTSCYLGDDLRDIHSIVAAERAGIPYHEFIQMLEDPDEKKSKPYKELRKAAKTVNFGSNYGIGAAKLARDLQCSEAEAKTFLDAKRNAYYGVEAWKLDVIREVETKGYVTTLYGSRKHLFNYYANSDNQKKSYYDRSTINYLIQGLAADYLKLVLSGLFSRRTFPRHNATLIAPIYDEIVFSCHSSQAVSLIKEVYQVMTQGIPGMEIPMLASPSVGINFGDQKEVLKNENQPLTDELIQIAINKALHPTS